MSDITFAEVEARSRAEGFDEVLERRWEPNATTAVHQHPFAVKAIVVDGEMWLTVGDATRHFRAAESFELDRSTPHAERYGSEGSTLWAARRHA